MLLRQLEEATRITTYLHSQLKRYLIYLHTVYNAVYNNLGLKDAFISITSLIIVCSVEKSTATGSIHVPASHMLP